MRARTYSVNPETEQHQVLSQALRELLVENPGLTGQQMEFVEAWLDRNQAIEEEDGPWSYGLPIFPLPELQAAEVVTLAGEKCERPRQHPHREAIALLLSFNRCPSCVL